MSKYARRKDLNHKEITDEITKHRDKGFPISFRDTHMVAKGFPDFVLGYADISFLIEVKQTSKHKLTVDEERFIELWHGNYFIVTSFEDMIIKIAEYFCSENKIGEGNKLLALLSY